MSDSLVVTSRTGTHFFALAVEYITWYVGSYVGLANRLEEFREGVVHDTRKVILSPFAACGLENDGRKTD